MKLIFILLCIAVFSLNVWARESAVIKEIEHNVKGTQLRHFYFSPLPHSNAIVMTMDTTAGVKQIVMRESEVRVALATLRHIGIPLPIQPRYVGHPPVAHAPLVPVYRAQSPGVPGAPAIVSSAVVAANQQASK